MNITPIYIDVYTERLTVMLLMAMVVHLVIIYGVSFVLPKPAKAMNSTMEILLVQTSTQQVPKKADYLAQANQEGGGEFRHEERPTTPLISPFPELIPEPVVIPIPPQQATPSQEPQFETLTTDNLTPYQTESWSEVIPPEEAAEQGHETQSTQLNEYITENALLIDAHAAKLASIQAELNKKFKSYAKRLRRKRIYASTQENQYVEYMEAWRRKVEEIGNANYPDKARQQKLAGHLVLDVALNPNGTIREVEIKKTSGSTILDEAALRIVRLAAPFEPFPEHIRKETDILHITRTWEFRYNSLTSR